MTTIIDRRLNPRDKTIKNRQKFIERSKSQIRRAVKEAIDNGNIADIENGKVKVKVKNIDEPSFHIDGKTGTHQRVLPGNRQHIVGDTIDKPPSGEGGGGRGGSPDGEGEDDFEFSLNESEVMDFIFEDLELPDLVKKQMKDVTKHEFKRCGYTNQGNPSQLDIVRSLKNGIGRRIGLARPKNDDIEKLEELLEQTTDTELRSQIEVELMKLRSRQKAIPWLDPFDIRYRAFQKLPQPMTKAVMFCLMDVSGSMGEREKDIAKRFFFFLHMFLRRKYDKVEIVFVRHTTHAEEVDEHTFFYDRYSGGTIVSTALKLCNEIITERYNLSDWNVYVAQASDGDNWPDDNYEAMTSMATLLPKVQYYAYVEIVNEFMGSNKASDLWQVYRNIQDDYKHLNLQRIHDVGQIWQVFKDLFTKELK